MKVTMLILSVAISFNRDKTYDILVKSVKIAAISTIIDTCAHNPPWFKISEEELLPLSTIRHSIQSSYFNVPTVQLRSIFKKEQSAVKSCNNRKIEIVINIIDQVKYMKLHPKKA